MIANYKGLKLELQQPCTCLTSAVYFVSLEFLLGLSLSSFISLLLHLLSIFALKFFSELLSVLQWCLTFMSSSGFSSTTVKMLERLLLPRNFKKKESRLADEE